MQTDHVKMLYDIGELNHLFTDSINIESFLQRIVEMVARHMSAEVCSIYLFDETKKELILKATVGLSSDSVNNVKLKLGEGLVGISLKDAAPICEKCAENNPNFKHYPGINEEDFKSFLAAPIIRGNTKIGVMVVQRRKGDEFYETDIMALRATASQLASMIENIKFIMSQYHESVIKDAGVDLEKLKFIKGKAASEGFAYDEIIIIDRENIGEILKRAKFEKQFTISDFENALKITEEQLERLQEKVEERLSDAASLIFSAHLLMLKDTEFTGGIRELIQNGENPPIAVLKNFEKYKNIFSKSSSALIREKAQDIGDLSKRVIDNIVLEEDTMTMYKGRIVIAKDVFPSDLLTMSAEDVGGIILVSGGVTSHVSILARSLQIPVVIINEPVLLNLPENTKALIDAEQGNVYINPSKEIRSKFEERNKARAKNIKEDTLLSQPTMTKDKYKINLMVNINLLSDLKNIENSDNNGVGLYRTEFPFIIRNDFPSEEEQFFIYSKLVKAMKDKPVIFRTLDIGGDKVLSYYQVAKEENPFLGMRSIRFSLTHQDIFRQQIKAILRAGYNSNVKIMFPMISSMDEFLLSRSFVYECVKELSKKNINHISKPDIGMMIEIPSVLNIIDEFAREANFFSIGTNDLIQYTLAVDRTNEKVADFYIPHHPSILRSLKKVALAAIENEIEVSICGDMAGDERYIPFLLGIGIRSLSVDSTYLPKVKKILSRITLKDAERIADDMLEQSKVSEVDRILEDMNFIN